MLVVDVQKIKGEHFELACIDQEYIGATTAESAADNSLRHSRIAFGSILAHIMQHSFISS